MPEIKPSEVRLAPGDYISNFLEVLLGRRESLQQVVDAKCKILPNGIVVITSRLATRERLRQAVQNLLGDRAIFIEEEMPAN